MKIAAAVAVVKPPVRIVFPTALPRANVPVPLPPATVVAAAPDALIRVVPTIVVAAKVDAPTGPNVPLTVRLPVSIVLPVALPNANAPVPPVAIVVTAAPDALIFAVPT